MYLYVVRVESTIPAYGGHWLVLAKDDQEAIDLLGQNEYTKNATGMTIVQKTNKPQVLHALPYAMTRLL